MSTCFVSVTCNQLLASHSELCAISKYPETSAKKLQIKSQFVMTNQSLDRRAADVAVMELVLAVLDNYGLDPNELTDEQLSVIIRFVITAFPYEAIVNSSNRK